MSASPVRVGISAINARDRDVGVNLVRYVAANRHLLRRLDAEASCTCLEAVRVREADLPFQVIVCFPDIVLGG